MKSDDGRREDRAELGAPGVRIGTGPLRDLKAEYLATPPRCKY